MLDKSALGLTIRTGRKSKRLTQDQLSSKTGLSRNYLSDVENGRYAPSLAALTRIAEQLDLDLNILKSLIS